MGGGGEAMAMGWGSIEVVRFGPGSQGLGFTGVGVLDLRFLGL